MYHLLALNYKRVNNPLFLNDLAELVYPLRIKITSILFLYKKLMYHLLTLTYSKVSNMLFLNNVAELVHPFFLKKLCITYSLWHVIELIIHYFLMMWPNWSTHLK